MSDSPSTELKTFEFYLCAYRLCNAILCKLRAFAINTYIYVYVFLFFVFPPEDFNHVTCKVKARDSQYCFAAGVRSNSSKVAP